MFEPVIDLLRSLYVAAPFSFWSGLVTSFLLLYVCLPVFALLRASSLAGELDVVIVRRRRPE